MLPFIIVAFVALVPGVSYRRVIAPAARRAFYRCAGRNDLGKRVHLYVEAAVLRRKAKRIDLGRGRSALEFANRNVPLLVSPRSRDLRAIQRLLEGPRLRKIKVISVKGRVVAMPGRPHRCALWVDRIKRTSLSRLE